MENLSSLLVSEIFEWQASAALGRPLDGLLSTPAPSRSSRPT
ncbi:MAG TPA: hypothetical protein VIZ18_17420 [Ktedonobacteraceae bacterium]